MAQSILGQLREALGSRRAIKIGAVTSRVGPLDYYGAMEIQGLRLGIEYATDGAWEVAGRPIQIFVEDDAGDPATGGQKARMLIEQEGVHILQGCASSAVAMVVAGIAEEYGRLFLIEPAAAVDAPLEREGAGGWGVEGRKALSWPKTHTRSQSRRSRWIILLG